MTGQYRTRFGSAGGLKIWRAPGRVNLIGEHTDYSEGFVLPIALDLATWIAAGPNSDGLLRIYSEERDESREWKVADIPHLQRSGDWSDYVVGVAHFLHQCGVELRPANFLIRSTVPEGSGLSSSAALEVSTALALLDGRPFDKVELAKLCQKAEIEFVGMPCGIMDQYISVFGQRDKAIRIDCRTLENQPVTLPKDVRILAINSMVKHALGDSAYRDRVRECAAAVEAIRKVDPSVKTLRDATPAHLEQARMDPLILRRARHVVSEDLRVKLFMQAAAANDLVRMGDLFVESHRSLQHDFEVSAEEVDFLVDAAIGMKGVYGARITGGGFGGCTVNLVAPEAVDRVQKEITWLYRERWAKSPVIIPCVPSDGAGPVEESGS